MKILIVGAGIIGSIYGWAFSEAGHDVTHFVRPGKAVQFKNGFTIDMLDKRKRHKNQFVGHYAIQATETLNPSDNYDLVIVPTKHFQLIEALKQIVPQVGNADFLLLTQNWDGTTEIDAILPPSRYVYGDAKAGGTFQNGNLIATIDSVDLGQVDNRQDECLKKTLALFKSADIKVTLHDNILHYLWVQYAITGGLWPALVRAGSLEVVLNNRKIGEQGLLAVKECLELVVCRGVDLKKNPEVGMYLNTSPLAMLIAGLALKMMFRFDKFMQRSSSHGLSDPQEIKVFYYDLLNKGKEYGISMPALSGFEPDIERFCGGN